MSHFQSAVAAVGNPATGIPSDRWSKPLLDVVVASVAPSSPNGRLLPIHDRPGMRGEEGCVLAESVEIAAEDG